MSFTVAWSVCAPFFSMVTRVTAICFCRSVKNFTFSGTGGVSNYSIVLANIDLHSTKKKGAMKPATIVTTPSTMKIHLRYLSKTESDAQQRTHLQPRLYIPSPTLIKESAYANYILLIAFPLQTRSYARLDQIQTPVALPCRRPKLFLRFRTAGTKSR
jgi:hypothetical protein